MKLQMRLSGPAEQLLNEMTALLETSPKEVVLDALALYYFAIEQVGQGRQIGSYEPSQKEFTAVATAQLQSLASRRGSKALSSG